MSQKDSQWSHSTFWVAATSALLLWAAFPPLHLWPLAWVAPIGWILLIRRSQLSGRRPYAILYLVGWMHWLAVIHWVRLPHWSAYFGWLALSGYLACYLPVFIGLSRLAVHRHRYPLMLVVPTVWCALEWIRGHLLTGFSMALMGHSQFPFSHFVQIADLVGACGLSWVMVCVSCGAAALLRDQRDERRWQPLAWSLVLLGLAVIYGHTRIELFSDPETETTLNVALVQGSHDTTFDPNDDPRDAFGEYLQLSLLAKNEYPETDLIVWPESMFTARIPWHEVIGSPSPPAEAEYDQSQLTEYLDYVRDESKRKAEYVAHQLDVTMLVGTACIEYEGDVERRFNSALWLDASGQLQGRYDKMHPVMFGEYVPLGERLPWLYNLTPMPSGLTAGTSPIAVEVGSLVFAPSICFENTVPHLVRRQVRWLADQGKDPDVLLTITNDGWFWGSALLDAHLACALFRAIELRRPMLIAANTGFSAWIDARGHVRAKGPRRESEVVMARIPAEVYATRRGTSVYLIVGDAFGCMCAGLYVVGVFVPSLLSLGGFKSVQSG